MIKGKKKLVLGGLRVQSFVTTMSSYHQVALRGGETLEEDSCIAIVATGTTCETNNCTDQCGSAICSSPCETFGGCPV